VLRVREARHLHERQTITRQELENRVLHALQKLMMSDAAVAQFFEGLREEQNRERMEQRARLAGTKSELAHVAQAIRAVIDAIKAGFHGPELKAEMEGLQARKTALQTQLESMKQPEPLLHPSMAAVYRKRSRSS
jgi:site-specific DNA recombinase